MRTKPFFIHATSIFPGVLTALALLLQPAHAQTAPSITLQPVSQTNLAGASTTLTVAVSGTGPFGYQWQINGANLPNDLISTVAGNGVPGYSADGSAATGASLNDPVGVAMDASGNLFIADMDNNRVRRVGANGIISTVAGNGSRGYSGDGGTATNAGLQEPSGVAVDAAGNLFIADQINNRIRKVDGRGMITTVAGNGSKGYSGDGGAAVSASLSHPQGVAVDALGDLFVADSGNNVIRRVDSAGIITTVAGNGSPGYSGDGGAATNARLANPSGVAVDGLGNLFIADPGNSVARQVDARGIITTVAGDGSQAYAGDGGPATNASLHSPFGLAVDGTGNLFIADNLNQRVRQVATNGIITTVAGNGSTGYFGDSGAAIYASLWFPQGVAVDVSGNLFVADSGNNRVRGVATAGFPILALDDLSVGDIGNYQVIVTGPNGSVTSAVASLTVLGLPAIIRQPANLVVDAGNPAQLSVAAVGTPPLSYAWYGNGVSFGASGVNPVFSLASASVPDTGGYFVVVADAYGSVTSVVATLLVGDPPVITGDVASQTEAAGASTTLGVQVSGTGPFGYQWRSNGTNLPNNLISTVAGNGTFGYFGDGGGALGASLEAPVGLAVDAYGELFIADQASQLVREVNANGIISLVAGSGRPGYSGDGGAATQASLNNPAGLAVDAYGDLFIADSGNNAIREVDVYGNITTVAGNGAPGFYGDGGPATGANLLSPLGVAVDASGNLLIADTGNNRIRQVDLSGTITTVAGNGSAGRFGDGGPAVSASLNAPLGVAADAAGNLYIADTQNSLVRKVDGNGFITTVAGTGSGGFSGDGGAATNASVNGPSAVAVDAFGDLYIADTGNNVIRQVDAGGIITTVAGNRVRGYFGDGGSATNASLAVPEGLALLSAGELLIADSGNSRVREVALGGFPSLIFGDLAAANGGDYQVVVSSPFGSATSSVAQLTVLAPPAVVLPPAGAAVAVGGAVTFSVGAVGTAPLSFVWYYNGTNQLASGSNTTYSLANVSVAEGGGYSVAVGNAYGVVTSLVASLLVGYPPAMAIEPAGQTSAAGGDVTFSATAAGTGPFRYQWRFNGAALPGDPISTLAGDGLRGSSGDGGAATNASLRSPSGVATDAAGNLFIADMDNNRVRKVDANGVITTVAGKGTQVYAGDGGPATNASLSSPQGVAVDALGNLFIADTGNQVVRKVDPNGIITTVAGNGNEGYAGDGGAATNASLNLTPAYYSPLDGGGGAAVDAAGNLLIADTGNNVIRKVDPNGIITTLAGNSYVNPNTSEGGYSGDGGAATNAGLNGPLGLAVDVFGNLFIADSANNVVRKVDPSGIITTVAGDGFFAGTGSGGDTGDGGVATLASLNTPAGVAVDSFGNLFIADWGNDRVREVDAKGVITAVAGSGSFGNTGDGGSATNAGLTGPTGLAVDAAGDLLIADSGNNAIRRAALAGFPVLTLTGVSAANAGGYQVVVTSPYGSVTSAVASLTVTPSSTQAAGIVMSFPVVASGNLILGFSVSQPLGASFTLLQTAKLTGPWTTNTGAVLTTNAQTGNHQFSVPVPGSVEFYQVRSP